MIQYKDIMWDVGVSNNITMSNWILCYNHN